MILEKSNPFILNNDIVMHPLMGLMIWALAALFPSESGIMTIVFIYNLITNDETHDWWYCSDINV